MIGLQHDFHVIISDEVDIRLREKCAAIAGVLRLFGGVLVSTGVVVAWAASRGSISP